MTVNIRKLLNGTVSLRDYIVKKCTEKGTSLKVIHEGQCMIPSPAELVTKKFQLANRLFKSKFGGPNYQLFDYEWRPSKKIRTEEVIRDGSNSTE